MHPRAQASPLGKAGQELAHVRLAQRLPAKRGDESSALVVGSARIEEMERASLVAALALSAGNRRLVAKRLGVSLRTVYNMLKRHHLAGE